MYVRFIVPVRDRASDQWQGIFTAAYALEREGKLLEHELVWLRGITAWFNRNLRRPRRLAWSTRANAPERAISWLKMSATEHLARLRELAALLEHKDVPVEELRTDKPGYVVYEDEYQVAAIPFGTETFGGGRR